MKKTLLSSFFLVFFIISAFSQRALLRGTVTDAATNEPLVGASVVVKGTTMGVVTDIDGTYQLERHRALRAPRPPDPATRRPEASPRGQTTIGSVRPAR